MGTEEERRAEVARWYRGKGLDERLKAEAEARGWQFDGLEPNPGFVDEDGYIPGAPGYGDDDDSEGSSLFGGSVSVNVGHAVVFLYLTGGGGQAAVVATVDPDDFKYIPACLAPRPTFLPVEATVAEVWEAVRGQVEGRHSLYAAMGLLGADKVGGNYATAEAREADEQYTRLYLEGPELGERSEFFR